MGQSCRQNVKVNQYRNYVHLQGQSYAEYVQPQKTPSHFTSNEELLNERLIQFRTIHSNLIRNKALVDVATSPYSYRNSRFVNNK